MEKVRKFKTPQEVRIWEDQVLELRRVEKAEPHQKAKNAWRALGIADTRFDDLEYEFELPVDLLRYDSNFLEFMLKHTNMSVFDLTHPHPDLIQVDRVVRCFGWTMDTSAVR